MWASMKPGVMVLPTASMTRVSGPISAPYFGLTADRDKLAVFDRKSLRSWVGAVDRDDVGSDHDQVGV